MREIALHLLDIAENSVAAGARNITISACEDLRADRLEVQVCDNGRGMDPELLAQVLDPFVTSRTTRKVGLGLPFLKAAAEACGGDLRIDSQSGHGTTVRAWFQHSHIDRMPLGDLAGTFLTILVAYPQVSWSFIYQAVPAEGDPLSFEFSDQPIKEALEGLPLSEPAVLAYLRGLLADGLGPAQELINSYPTHKHSLPIGAGWR
jgi:hypothetical protein